MDCKLTFIKLYLHFPCFQLNSVIYPTWAEDASIWVTTFLSDRFLRRRFFSIHMYIPKWTFVTLPLSLWPNPTPAARWIECLAWKVILIIDNIFERTSIWTIINVHCIAGTWHLRGLLYIRRQFHVSYFACCWR